MDYITLWRSGALRAGYCYFFWQYSQPYRIGDNLVIRYCVSPSLPCVVYALGGRVELWRGCLGDVPKKFRSYLSEVCVDLRSAPVPPPPAP